MRQVFRVARTSSLRFSCRVEKTTPPIDQLKPMHYEARLPGEARFREKIRGKFRHVVAWTFGIVLVLLSTEPPSLPGILVCFAGATLRFWASGYLLKDAKLTIMGPYQFTRNPLYLGTYLMAIGASLAVGNIFFFAAATVAFAAVYHFIILDEETKLEGLFGAPFLEYKKRVPRFFPRPFPLSRKAKEAIVPDPIVVDFSWKVAMRNKAFEAYLVFGALMGGLLLVSTLRGLVS